MTLFYDSFDTPLGLFSVALNDSGEVLATAFGGRERLVTRFDGDKLERSTEKARKVREEIQAYLNGKRRTFTVSLAPQGTAFQQKVWSALLQIPYGKTQSYGELAASIGRPKAARAVGRANATNPICLIVPCHRVIGANGSLTGFAFGEDIKRRLLALESA